MQSKFQYTFPCDIEPTQGQKSATADDQPQHTGNATNSSEHSFALHSTLNLEAALALNNVLHAIKELNKPNRSI